MNKRANYQKLSPASYQALVALEKSFADSPLEKTLIDIVKIRVSQMNGCLFCLDLHSKEARSHGDKELRLYHLLLWRESSLFSDREKAALTWAELLTLPDQHGVEDGDYELMEAYFTEKEISDLTMVIAAINAWNRLGIAFRGVPGALDKVMGLEKIGLHLVQ